MQRFLIIQTAFIGDVILATAVIEKLHAHYPDARIDFLLRKGNEGLLKNHPHISRLYVLDKRKKKWARVMDMIRELRQTRYDQIINLQRFMTTGLITLFARAGQKTGFDKNPLSRFYDRRMPHVIGDGTHETERNLGLVRHLTDDSFIRPRLYPSENDFQAISRYTGHPFVCIAPASVWYTKQFPADRWVALINRLPDHLTVYLIGGPDDQTLCRDISQQVDRKNMYNLAGKHNFLETAALMKQASMNYVNDSAPLHIASAMNAPVRAVFCSTIPEFGFYPLSDDSKVVEVPGNLYCRPCGLHGFKSCPEGHFRCARDIEIQDLLT